VIAIDRAGRERRTRTARARSRWKGGEFRDSAEASSFSLSEEPSLEGNGEDLLLLLDLT